eukprot:PhM_4_TR2382/c0_g2_i1/m.10456/K12345/SRD5A3; 3-oxo-5-alpha-steroid 4-dehydrogenase 3
MARQKKLFVARRHRQTQTQPLLSMKRGTAFLCFYHVGVGMTLFCLVIVATTATTTTTNTPMLIWVVFACYGLHTMRRMFECLFVHKFSQQERMSLFVAAAGGSFYVATPLTFLFFFNASTYYSFTDVMALVTFVAINVAQNSVHKILASLRENNNNSNNSCATTEERVYHLPPFHKLLFPHYALEIALYVALAVLAFNPTATTTENICVFFPALFSFVNLSATAREQRRWYEDRFSPNVREAARFPRFNIIPGVW